MKKAILWLMVWLLPVMLGACSSGGGGDSGGGGGGGGGAEATALTVATQVSVVDAKLTGSVAGVAPLKFSWFKAVAADFASTSDYTADKTQIWVSERSAEAFEEINNILCMVAQTKYDAMLNQGNYIALVDNNQCDSSKSDASSAGQESQNQSSSAEMPDYMTFVINSSRLNNTSDEIVKVWVHEKAMPDKQEPEKVIFVKLTVTESVSDTNPYGLFHMEFIGYPSTNGVPDTNPGSVMFKGFLRSRMVSGEVILELVEENYGSWPGSRKIALNKKADGTGTGTVSDIHSENSVTVTSTFDIAFNPDYFKRSDGTNTMCLSRSQFEESAWRYGLYDSTGKRVNRNSGFSVNTMADGSGSYGWVGYWGLWLDNNATVVNNTLYKYDYSTGSATPYTLFKAGGKLKKHTKNNLTLLEIKGIPLDYWDNGTNYRVVWDGTNFNKVAQMPSNCTNNCMWSEITTIPTPTINFNQVQWSELNFWSQSLGGQVRVPLPGCTWTDPDGPGPLPGYTTCTAPNNSTLVIFFKEDIVYPTDTIPASLVCYDNCLKAGATGIDPMDSNYSSWDQNTGQSTAHNYTFSVGTMLLNDSTSSYNVVSSSTSTVNQWGYMSGALVDTTTPNLATLLDCNWDGDNNPATNAQVCGWKAWSVLDVFYTWETGPNNWNQLSLLQDTVSSATLTFEPPLQVKYIHHKAGSPLDGATFMMDYSGFGQLNGIPGKCVNMETGIDADCSSGGPGSPIRWVPAFVIPPTQADGSLTEVTADTVTYYVKPLEMEQRMKQDAGGCSGLTITPYPLPSISDWVNPSLGTEPPVTAPPAVIGGVVQ